MDICEQCFISLPHNSFCCPTCALPLPPVPQSDSIPLQCGTCLATKSPLARACVPFIYESPSDYIVHQLKYHGSLKFGRAMGELLANSLEGAASPDLLIPVPQHPHRLRQRGFNHAMLIADTTGRRLGIPVDSEIAYKRDDRPSQSGLNAKARKLNMRDAFVINTEIKVEHIAVVDDVMTTGATSSALAKALRRAGCKQVSLWAFARTP